MKKTAIKKGTTLPKAIKIIIVIDILIALFLLLVSASLFAENQFIKQDPEKATQAFMKAIEQYPSLHFTEAEGKAAVLKMAEAMPYIITVLLMAFILHALLVAFLWKKKPWARMMQIVIAILAVLYGLLIVSTGAIVFGILVLLVEGWIASYLLFTPEGKKAFTSEHS